MTKETPYLHRIHIGGISIELAKSIADLENRISKFGHVVKPLELHEKSILGYHFAYITMHLKKSEFLKLKKMFDGTRFKGSNLSIQLAKDDYQTRWKKDFKRQDTKIGARKVRNLTAINRLDRISQQYINPFKLSQVCKGRMRKTPRKLDLKNLTIRIRINGRLKVIKCLKSKLWGYDKNRKIRDLTYRFVGGEWRDGNDHVVDRFTGKLIVFDDAGITVEDNLSENKKTEIDDELKEEQAKTNYLLSKMLDQYNFDKPVDMNEINLGHEESELDEDSDYETSHKNKNIDSETITVDYDKIPTTFCIRPSSQELKVTYFDNELDGNTQKEQKTETTDNFTDESAAAVDNNNDNDDEYFCENRSRLINEKAFDNNISSFNSNDRRVGLADQLIDKSSVKNASDKKEHQDEDDSTEEEFIPSFGKPDLPVITDSENTTEKLRSLLSISTTSEKVSIIDASIENNLTDVPVLKSLKSTGLFFSHLNSPFLVAQTQISKLKEVKFNEELKYDEWFWENRGDLNREFRRLRRDALRRNKKKLRSHSLI